MKSFNFQTFSYILLVCLIGGGSACNLSNLTSDRNISAARSQNDAPKTSGDISGSADQDQTQETTGAVDFEGTYELNNHRDGEGGYVNTLSVEKPENGKMRVSFEGTYFYQANGAETFHESSAYGTLNVTGNVAKGNLTEEGGSQNACRIELNFSANDRVNLKSTSCDLNVTPDGVYRRGAEDKSRNLDADVVEQDRRRKSPDNDQPFIQYDQAGGANGIVNLMERDGEREGCEETVTNYVGEVVKVDYIGDYVYEFTLKSDNRKPQNVSLALAAEDRLPFSEVREIIKRGNHLEVTFILCGNAGIATPTAIYKR